MNSAGRIKLITDITRSDRERLPDWAPEDERGGMVVATLAGLAACAVFVAAMLWVLA